MFYFVIQQSLHQNKYPYPQSILIIILCDLCIQMVLTYIFVMYYYIYIYIYIYKSGCKLPNIMKVALNNEQWITIKRLIFALKHSHPCMDKHMHFASQNTTLFILHYISISYFNFTPYCIKIILALSHALCTCDETFLFQCYNFSFISIWGLHIFSLISRVCKLLIQLEVARGMLQKNEH